MSPPVATLRKALARPVVWISLTWLVAISVACALAPVLAPGDPLAQMRVSVPGYRRMAAAIQNAADEMCEGRLVLVLEGGYDLDGLGACAAATFELLCQERAPVGEAPASHGETALRNIAATRRALAAHLKGFG